MSNDKAIFIGSQLGFATIINTISKYDPQGQYLRRFLRVFNYHTIKSILEQLGAYNANYQPKRPIRTDFAVARLDEFIEVCGIPDWDGDEFLRSISNHEYELFNTISEYIKRTSFEFGWGVYRFELRKGCDGVLISFDGDYRIMEWERIRKENPELAPLCFTEDPLASTVAESESLIEHALASICTINEFGFKYLMSVGDEYYRDLCSTDMDCPISICKADVTSISTLERLWEFLGNKAVRTPFQISAILGKIPGFMVERSVGNGIEETPIQDAILNEDITYKQLEKLDEILSTIAVGLKSGLS